MFVFGILDSMELWCSWLTYCPVTAEIAGSCPVSSAFYYSVNLCKVNVVINIGASSNG